MKVIDIHKLRSEVGATRVPPTATPAAPTGRHFDPSTSQLPSSREAAERTQDLGRPDRFELD